MRVRRSPTSAGSGHRQSPSAATIVDMLRPAGNQDLDFLRILSHGVSDAALIAQIRDGRLRIVEHARSPIGFLKFCVLWETLPFIEVLLIIETERQTGYGTHAVQDWEREMRDRGFDLVLASTQADETAQHFWRKLGYVDCGSLTVRNQPAEIFMQHKLG